MRDGGRRRGVGRRALGWTWLVGAGQAEHLFLPLPLPAEPPPLLHAPALLPACRGFQAIADQLIVGPILKTLVFSTTAEQTREWVDSICSDWNFTSIIPAVSG